MLILPSRYEALQPLEHRHPRLVVVDRRVQVLHRLVEFRDRLGEIRHAAANLRRAPYEGGDLDRDGENEGERADVHQTASIAQSALQGVV